MSVSATTPLEWQVVSLGKQLSSIQVQITASQKKMNDLAEGITARDEEIKSRYVVFGQRVRKYYKDSLSQFTFTDLMEKIGSSSTLNEFMLNLAYGQRIANQDKDYIVSVTQDVLGLEKDKKQVEDSKTKLAALQAKLDIQKKFFDTEIAKAKSYQSQLQGQIAALSAKQQQLLAAKLGTLNIPLYAYSTQGGCSSDISPYVDPGFGGTKFAIFTYGVPNRVGLNQYGAWGRAKAGQDSNAILRAYYNFDSYQNMNATIKVNDGNGYNTGNIIWSGSLEDYIKRIWEVPDSWTDNNLAALKAQAIAARSYVLAETNNGSKSICANTYCQVFRTNPKGGNWESAVSQTSGQVMVQGGSPIVAYFSSTHGGYVYQSGGTISSRPWLKNAKDTSDGNINSFSDLQSKAYDRESPWFYCDWGGRKQYNNTAWMTSSEMADIVNSILLVQVDSSADPHILQTDNTSDSNMWNPDKVRQELSSHRTPFTTINSASVSVDFGGGVTTQIHFSGDAGSVDFGGDVFKKYFNLRAPANIQVVGPLFNVERR
jgi:SpoIID/LytB domain protein